MKFTYRNFLLIFLAAACALGVAYTLYLIFRWGTQPNQLDFGEGFMLYLSKLWAHGQFQWNPNNQPYMPMMYGVVWPTLAAPFIWLFGPDLRIGRVISILATIVITLLMYLIARRYTKRKLIPWLAALLPFTFFGYQEWVFQARVDMLAIMFETLGFYFALRWWKAGSKVLWTIPLFLLAFFTKQSAIGFALAVGIGLLIDNRKLFLKYVGIMAGSLAVIVLAGNLLTGGWFWVQLFVYNATTPFLNPPGPMSQMYFMMIAPLIFQIVLTLGFVLKKIQSRELNLPTIWILVAIPLSLFLLVRYASFVNYGLEMVLALGLGTALYFDTKTTERAALTGVLAFNVAIVAVFFATGLHFIPMPDSGYQARINTVDAIIKDTQQPIYTEEAGLVLEAGKAPYYEPFVYTQMIIKGYFPEQKVLDDLNSQRLDYLVFNRPAVYPPRTWYGHITLKAMDAVAANYHIVYNTFEQPGGGEFWYSFTVYQANRLGGAK